MAVRAIPTSYNGVLYASGLEADWSRTFQALRMPVVNEPDGILVPGGRGHGPTMYLPDFWAPLSRVAIEAKGAFDTGSGKGSRLFKPALLADATAHAPGCEQGRPERVFTRPAGARSASCSCGFGPDFPWILVVVARSAVPARKRGLPPSQFGYACWEPPPGVAQNLVIVECPIRHRPFFMDLDGLPFCRCCWQPLPPGTPAKRSGEVPFLKVPRGVASKAKRAS